MKPCDRVDSLLSAHLEHETSPAEARFLDDHLQRCSRCRRQVSEMGGLMKTLSALPRVKTAPDFTQRVIARTVGLEPAGLDAPGILVLPSRRPAWALPLAAAAALALISVTVLQLGRTPTAPVETAQNASPMAGAPEPAAIPSNEPALPAVAPPQVKSLGSQGEATSLGMARDAYVLEDYELREPTDGGAPVLTRASAKGDAQVVVTF
jgi:anti-sigma factor RsiW